jgi:dienelactone hydrolase
MADQELSVEISDVTWPSPLATIHGTLVRPHGPGSFPAVLMVAGSGPTNRDWNSPILPGSNGSARLIAEALARAGFASLRYDKLASDPQIRETWQTLVGKFSMQSHLDELTGAVHTLASQSWVRKNRIFALTNSEGALHALNYQLHRPTIGFAGLVLTGPPGRTVGAVARSQIAAQLDGLPDGNEMMAIYDTAIAHFSAGEPIAPEPSLPQAIQMVLQGLASPLNLPFARELWTADAAAILRQVNVPVLVIIGKKDIQIDWQADGELLQRAAAGHKDITFLFPENVNHVLKHEPRPRSELQPDEVTASYNAPGAFLDPEVPASILEWLAAHV